MLLGIETFGLGLLIGLIMGFIGGGGGSVYLILLTFVRPVPVHQAIGTSLILASLTSLSAVITHWRAGRMMVRLALLVGAIGALAAALAGFAAAWIPAAALKAAVLAGLVIVSLPAVRWLRQPAGADATPQPLAMAESGAVSLVAAEPKEPAVDGRGGSWADVAAGTLLGLGAGGVGLSGTAPLTTYFTAFAGLSAERALGTATLATFLATTAASITYTSLTAVDLSLAGWIGGGALLGGHLGARLVGRVSRRLLLSICSVLTLLTVIGMAVSWLR